MITSEQITLLLTEIEKRFRERTPPPSAAYVLPGYRVSRSEIHLFARQNGFKEPFPRESDKYDRGLYLLFDRLRLEFPNEKWDPIGCYSADRTRRKELGLPPRSNSRQKVKIFNGEKA